MIALLFQFGAALLQFGVVLVGIVVLLALAGRIRPTARAYVRLGILVVGITALWGIGQWQQRATHYAWEQEVSLGVGQSILIRRHTEFGHYGELAQINRAISVLEDFKFTHPITGQVVSWQEHDGLRPLLLNLDKGIPYLAAELMPGQHYHWGCPPHPYVFFKYSDGQWRRIGIKQFPERFEYANVLPYLTERSRTATERTGNRMSAYEAERLIGEMSNEIRKLDRRIVNPLYSCRGSVDATYGSGVTKKLQDQFGTNPTQNEITEREAINLGIIKLGEEK